MSELKLGDCANCKKLLESLMKIGNEIGKPRTNYHKPVELGECISIIDNVYRIVEQTIEDNTNDKCI